MLDDSRIVTFSTGIVTPGAVFSQSAASPPPFRPAYSTTAFRSAELGFAFDENLRPIQLPRAAGVAADVNRMVAGVPPASPSATRAPAAPSPMMIPVPPVLNRTSTPGWMVSVVIPSDPSVPCTYTRPVTTYGDPAIVHVVSVKIVPPGTVVSASARSAHETSARIREERRRISCRR